MSDHDTANLLNELILTTQDEEMEFAEAEKLAEDPKLKLLFKDCAKRCGDATAELQAHVMLLGKDPQYRGSLVGAARRGWTELKAAVKDSNVAVLEQLERGQDHAKAAYVKALKTTLPSRIMLLLQRQYDGVVGRHDRIRELRRQYRAAA
jgi:uncharacterized protein (TIGR02284 family)